MGFHLVTFWCTLGFYVFISHFDLFRKYKINQKPPKDSLISEAYRHTIIVQTIGFFATYAYSYFFSTIIGMDMDFYSRSEIPPIYIHVLHIIGCILFEDCMFYWVHRTLHHKSIYAKIHKQHHKFTINHPIAAEYAHPVEGFFGNFLPFFLPQILFGLHGSTVILWTLLRVAEAVDGHSGYDIPLSPFNLLRDGARHDFHHTHGGGPDGVGTTGVFGSLLGFWDWFCGTDKPFKDYVKQKKAK